MKPNTHKYIYIPRLGRNNKPKAKDKKAGLLAKALYRSLHKLKKTDIVDFNINKKNYLWLGKMSPNLLKIRVIP